MHRIKTLLAFSAALLPAGALQAQVIFAPISGVVDLGGTFAGTFLGDTWNQDGLVTGYTANVTNFDTYLAGDPQHNFLFSTEWFTETPNDNAIVTYDFGATRSFDRLAFWNEDGAGVVLVRIGGSNDNITFLNFGSFFPTDNPINSDYGADVFAFATQSYRYVRLSIAGCPQTDHGFAGCSIGEVAFRAANPIPEPATWGLMLSGFGLAGAALRRRSAAPLHASA